MRQLGFLALAAAVVLTLILLSRTQQSGRDADLVQDALLGHWQAENGDQIYYGRDQAVAVSQDGTWSFHPYRVLMLNQEEGWVKILIANSEGEDTVRLLRFSPDRRSYQTTLRFATTQGQVVQRVATAHYVDAETAPAP